MNTMKIYTINQVDYYYETGRNGSATCVVHHRKNEKEKWKVVLNLLVVEESINSISNQHIFVHSNG